MRKPASARSSGRRKGGVRRGAGTPDRPATRRFNVEFLGKAWMKGIISVEAKDEQEARAKALAEMHEGGIVWEYIEEDEEYDAHIRETDPL